MFRRKKKPETLSDEVIAEEIKKAEDQKDASRETLKEARQTVSVLNRIREENHIVKDLREVLGGR